MAQFDSAPSRIDRAIKELSDLTFDLERGGGCPDDRTDSEWLKRNISAHMNAARECLRAAESLAYQVGTDLADEGSEYTSDDVRMFLDSTCEDLVDVGICVYGLH